MTRCPCCSNKSYQDCCQPYIQGEQFAPTAEALMRSRYTAYTLAKVEYLRNTSRGKAAADFNPQHILQFAKQSQWQGLDVLRSYQPFPNRAYVEFVAHYNDARGKHQHLCELSEFHLEDDRWYYVDGKQEISHGHHHAEQQPIRNTQPKQGRNDPCLCGSGQKYKKCCGK